LNTQKIEYSIYMAINNNFFYEIIIFYKEPDKVYSPKDFR